MPIIYLTPSQINKKNNIHIRRLDELIWPIIGRGSQNKTPEHIQADLKRQTLAYITCYKER